MLNDALSIYFPDPAADGVCLFFASTTEGNRSVLMPALGISEKFPMTSRHPSSIRKKYFGITFVISGVLFWMLVVAVPLTPLHVGLASLGHVEKQFLGVVVGGASVAGGIMLLLAPARSRRRISSRHRTAPGS